MPNITPDLAFLQTIDALENSKEKELYYYSCIVKEDETIIEIRHQIYALIGAYNNNYYPIKFDAIISEIKRLLANFDHVDITLFIQKVRIGVSGKHFIDLLFIDIELLFTLLNYFNSVTFCVGIRRSLIELDRNVLRIIIDRALYSTKKTKILSNRFLDNILRSEYKRHYKCVAGKFSRILVYDVVYIIFSYYNKN